MNTATIASANKRKQQLASMATTLCNDDDGDDNLSLATRRRCGALCSIPSSTLVTLDYTPSSSAPPIQSMMGPLVVSISPKNMKKSKKNKSPKAQKKMKKGVSFQESRNQAYENQNVYKEDLKQLWYNHQDYAAFKESTAQCAMEVVAASVLSSQSSMLESSSSSSSSYPQTLQHVYEACVQCQSEETASVLTVSEDVHLKNCLAKAPSRWGVERAAVRWIAADRHYRRSAMLELVLEMQQTMGLFANNDSSGGSTSNITMFIDDGMDEVLRTSCEALSRPSRLFARHLAQAAAE
jgi:hypothetical protein